MRSFSEVAAELLVEYAWTREPHWGAERYRPGQVVAEPVAAADGERVLLGAWTTHDGDGVYVAAFVREQPLTVASPTALRCDERGVREVRVPAFFRPPAAVHETLLRAREAGGRVERRP